LLVIYRHWEVSNLFISSKKVCMHVLLYPPNIRRGI